MKHYVLPVEYDGSSSVEITGEEFRYLTRVLRKRQSESFRGTDSMGTELILTVSKITEKSCILTVNSQAAKDRRPALPWIDLYQCLPKGQKMDLIVRQATEVGVERVIPVESAYSIAKIRSGDEHKKMDRWTRIARQATQQSGRPKEPEIMPPIRFSRISDIWENEPENVGIFFHHIPLGSNSLHALLAGKLGKIGICIGPEGGLSDEEADTLLKSGFHPVYINTNVLRTETAALYATASIQTVLLEKDSWTAPK